MYPRGTAITKTTRVRYTLEFKQETVRLAEGNSNVGADPVLVGANIRRRLAVRSTGFPLFPEVFA